MAPNPNPARISEPLWWFAEQCFASTPTVATASENGGLWFRKAGSHADRDWLIAQGRTNDYSIRDPMNKQGPGDKGAALDWTFPAAQRGDYHTIVAVMDRVEAAFHANDPRTYGLFEVLGQADHDEYAEGFVFYPTKRVRTPDVSHLWHIHFGFIRAYLNDWKFFRGLWSLVRGLTYQQWLAEGDDDMFSDADRSKLDTVLFTLAGPGMNPEHVRDELERRDRVALDEQVKALRADVAELKARPPAAFTDAQLADIADRLRALLAAGQEDATKLVIERTRLVVDDPAGG